MEAVKFINQVHTCVFIKNVLTFSYRCLSFAAICSNLVRFVHASHLLPSSLAISPTVKFGLLAFTFARSSLQKQKNADLFHQQNQIINIRCARLTLLLLKGCFLYCFYVHTLICVLESFECIWIKFSVTSNLGLELID